MSNISKLRDAADLLLNQGHYEAAYNVYNEVYRQIWGALGTVQSGLSEFSYGYLTHNIRSSIEFKNLFTEHAVNTTFIKCFNLDTDQTLNEFTFTVFGHLRCITSSSSLIDKLPTTVVLNEFLILYNLIIHAADDKWVTYLFKIASPVVENTRLKKVRHNLQDNMIHNLILQSAQKIKSTDWEPVNFIIIEYLDKAGVTNTDFYKSLYQVNYASRPDANKKKYKKYERYEKYEKYERYEKYEKYENGREEFKYNQNTSGSNSGNTAHDEKKSEFDIKTATDDEKAKYFGKVLSLEGKVTKSDIRRKYLEAIAKYHPDKVQNLGADILELAEKKTKEINIAYDWFKAKFNI